MLTKIARKTNKRWIAMLALAFFIAGPLTIIGTAVTADAKSPIPKPKAPTGVKPTTGEVDAIGWFTGLFKDASNVGILIIGVALFVIGAVGMVWSVMQIVSGKGTFADVAKVGLASAAAMAFGTYALSQATNILK